MGLSVEDRILIKNFYFAKGYGADSLINEFPAKGWKKSMLCVYYFVYIACMRRFVTRWGGPGGIEAYP